MSPEKQRKAIAEACGWTLTKYPDNTEWPTNPAGKFGTSAKGSIIDFPDYLNDLNAMHRVEVAMSNDNFRIYLGFLNHTRTIPHLMSMLSAFEVLARCAYAKVLFGAVRAREHTPEEFQEAMRNFRHWSRQVKRMDDAERKAGTEGWV